MDAKTQFGGRKKQPSQAELGGLLGHYQNGRYGDAEMLGRSITQRYPRHQLSWKVLGAALNQARKFQESLIPNQKAVDLDPKDAEARIILGSTLQQLGRLEQAEASYKKAIRLCSSPLLLGNYAARARKIGRC